MIATVPARGTRPVVNLLDQRRRGVRNRMAGGTCPANASQTDLIGGLSCSRVTLRWSHRRLSSARAVQLAAPVRNSQLQRLQAVRNRSSGTTSRLLVRG